MPHRFPCFTDVFHRPFLRLGFSFLAIAVLSASSCPTDAGEDSPCGADDQFNMIFATAAQALTSADLEVTLSEGVRTFTWSRLVENVCAEKNVQARWSVGVAIDKLPPGWRVDAGYVITSVTGSFVTLTPKDGATARAYEAEAEIGLRQSYQGQPGRFLTFMAISFTSQGNIQADQAVVQSLHRLFTMNAYYKRAKTN